MTLGDGFPAASGSADSTELRKALAGLVLRDATGAARSGIFPQHSNALVTSKASMAVDVAAFVGCTVRGGGPVFMANDGTVTVSVDAAPASNSRIDVVYFMQHESAAPYTDPDNNPVIAIAKGTAATSPSKPAIPTGASELATILIPSGVSATNAGGVVITQTFQYTTSSGGLLWVRNPTELAALPTFPVGTRVLDLSTASTYRSTGAALLLWDAPLAFTVASGFTLVGGAVYKSGRTVTLTVAVTATGAYTLLNPIITITDTNSRPIINARISSRNGTSATNGLAYISTGGVVSTQVAIASGDTFDFSGSFVTV